MDEPSLRQMFGHFTTGVAVVTAQPPAGDPVGITINSFTSVSLTPGLVMFGLTRSLLSVPAFLAAGRYGINMLAHGQEELSRRFATRGGDKWNRTVWHPGANGAPLLEGAIAHIECTVHKQVEAGDHLLMLCEVTAFAIPGAHEAPLVFFKGRYCALHPEALAPAVPPS